MHIVRLKKGDRIVATIEAELDRLKIKAGFLWGLGAISEVELMVYDLKDKSYSSKIFKGVFEVTSFSATITKGVDKPVMIHPHIVISGKDFNCYGGHLKEGIVAATLEVAIEKSSQKLERYADKHIGLNLIK